MDERSDAGDAGEARTRSNGKSTGRSRTATGETAGGSTGATESDATGAGTGNKAKSVELATGVLEVSDVQVDPQALELEADAIAAAHAPELPPEGAPVDSQAVDTGNTPEQVLQGYQLVCTALVDRGADALAPAWDLTREEKGSFADACARALLLWFPDQIIPPKYMALLVVAGVGLEIVGKRRDPKTGALKPRFHAAKPAPVAAPVAPAATPA